MKHVKNFIERKTLLYRTGVEYGDYTINHIQGCSHGCKYPCYAFLMAKRFGKVKDYKEWVSPFIVSNALILLDKEIPKYKDKIKSVHLSFSTDPFMYRYNDISNLSLAIIEKLNNAGIKCTVLTKGILPIKLSNFSLKNEYGITLISLDENYRKKMEPGAAPYEERIEALFKLHKKGCKTWVSIEPYPTPNLIKQDLKKILKKIKFVDKIIFGRMNYNSKIKEYNDYQNYYNDLSNQVIKFCKENDIRYHIKNGTITK